MFVSSETIEGVHVRESHDRMTAWLEVTQVVTGVVEAFRKKGVGIAQWKKLLANQEKLDRIVAIFFEEEVATEVLRDQYSEFGENVPKENILDFLDGFNLTTIERALACDQLGSVDKIRPVLERVTGWKRAALCLYFGLGPEAVKYEREEIAEMLRINIGSVKSWLGSRTSGSSFASKLSGEVRVRLDRPHGVPIDVIGLSPRATNQLIAARVLTREMLVSLSVDDLRTHGLDEKRIDEIQFHLAQNS